MLQTVVTVVTAVVCTLSCDNDYYKAGNPRGSVHSVSDSLSVLPVCVATQ